MLHPTSQRAIDERSEQLIIVNFCLPNQSENMSALPKNLIVATIMRFISQLELTDTN